MLYHIKQTDTQNAAECVAYRAEFNLTSFLAFNASDIHARKRVQVMLDTSITRQLVDTVEALFNHNHHTQMSKRKMY